MPQIIQTFPAASLICVAEGMLVPLADPPLLLDATLLDKLPVLMPVVGLLALLPSLLLAVTGPSPELQAASVSSSAHRAARMIIIPPAIYVPVKLTSLCGH